MEKFWILDEVAISITVVESLAVATIFHGHGKLKSIHNAIAMRDPGEI